MIIDTHCHYNLEPLFTENGKTEIPVHGKEYTGHVLQLDSEGKVRATIYESWKDHWEKAQENGVGKAIVVGTEFRSSAMAQTIALNDRDLFASIGVHPNEAYSDFYFSHSIGEIEDIDNNEYDQLSLLGYEKIVAIGETGLDYFHLPSDHKHQQIAKILQKKSFISQIQLAKDYKLPLIVHVRDKEVVDQPKEGNAYWDALQILQEHDVKDFVLHCASGPLSYIKQAIEMGGYMGFDGNITYPNAQHVRDIFTIVPEDRRMVETDAPYLPPQSHRGKICEPWMIAETVQYIEENLKVDPTSFYENSVRLFKF